MMLTTEHGVFTANEKTGQTAQEVYEAWLATKNSPPQPSEIEILSNYVLDVDMRLIMVELGMEF